MSYGLFKPCLSRSHFGFVDAERTPPLQVAGSEPLRVEHVDISNFNQRLIKVLLLLLSAERRMCLQHADHRLDHLYELGGVLEGLVALARLIRVVVLDWAWQAKCWIPWILVSVLWYMSKL